jgi:hypothetical protein
MENVNENKRGTFLTAMAILFSILTFSNFTKPLQYLRQPDHLGIVIFGVRFESFASNLILGPAMGLLVGAYAYGLWKMRSWLAPLSVFYAFYVPLNLVLFWYRQTGPDIPSLSFMLIYLAFALTGSIGTALYLAYHREKLS